jgi:hypothetical protein
MSYDFPVQGIGKLISLQITATYGCTDSTAFNYNPSATVSNGTCIPFIYGCTVQFSSTLVNAQGLPAQATNYNSSANTNQVSSTDTSDPCSYGPSGCTTQFAGSGTPQQLTAQFYDPTAVVDDGSCAYLGCTDSSQANYNPYATANDPNNPCIASLIHIPDPHFRYVLVNGNNVSITYNGVPNTNIAFWEVVGSTATPISGFGINNSSWRNIYGIIDPNGEYIDKTLVTGITHLDLTNSNSGLSATNLTGINYFTALKVLKCNDQSLGALNVSQNTALIELRCGDNQLTSLNVTQNTALTKFYCYNNQLTSLDVSQNTALTTLSCNINQLTSLDVSQNTALVTLNCAENKLSTIVLTSNTLLRTLNCEKQRSLINPNDSLLTSLNLTNNTSLIHVDCRSNNIGPTLDISQNLGLTYLDCGGQGQGPNTRISSIAGLNSGSALPLITLRCGNNLLTAVQVSNYPNLKTLLCGGNRLTSLDVTANTNLVDLRCSENYLTSLDLRYNIKLERVSANSNSFGWAFGTTASNANTGTYVPNINNILNIQNGHPLGNGTLNNPNGTTGRFNTSRAWPLFNQPMEIKVNNKPVADANYLNIDSNTTFEP